MIPVIVIGTSAYSRKLYRLIRSVYNPYAKEHGFEELSVMAFFDMFDETDQVSDDTLDGLLLLNRYGFSEIIKTDRIQFVLLPQQPELDVQFLIHFLRENRVYQDMIYFTMQKLLEQDEYTDRDIENLMIPYAEASYLPYLEFHIEDSCNMNCKACEHYSPLVKASPQTRMVFNEVKQDFQKLKSLIDDIGRIRILGGEPLLNPELSEYVKMIRQTYPLADIFIVTNALLLHRLPEETYAVIKEANASFMISYYPPLEGKIEEIEAVPKAKGIRVLRTPLIREFSLRQNLDGHNDPEWEYEHCFQSTCINVYRGRIGTCMLPFMTHYFNETFHTEIPEDGGIDLYDPALTTVSLKQQLEKPLKRCAYCGQPKNVPWKRVNKEPDLRDFILMEEKDDA